MSRSVPVLPSLLERVRKLGAFASKSRLKHKGRRRVALRSAQELAKKHVQKVRRLRVAKSRLEVRREVVEQGRKTIVPLPPVSPEERLVAAVEDRSKKDAVQVLAPFAPHVLFSDRFRAVTHAVTPEMFPSKSLPELAFAGRSNVGKSSLLRALALKHLHIESADRPGTTRAVGFFENRYCRLVDLPGYGFAFGDPDKVRTYQSTTTAYFEQRPKSILRNVFLLADARVGLKQADLGVLRELSQQRHRFRVVLTKVDLVREKELARQMYRTGAKLLQLRAADQEDQPKPSNHDVAQAVAEQVLLVSSVSRAGVAELWNAAASFMPGEVKEQLRSFSGPTRK